MQVSIANFLPSPVSGLVLATFISEGSEDIAAKLRTYGIGGGDMSEIVRERGKKSLVQLPGALLWTMGMGPKPSRERIRQAASQLVSFANEYGHEWRKDRYVADKDAVLSQSGQIADTYWLMERLLDNMQREFG